MSAIRVYGLPNCDTCRRALKWFAGHGIEASLLNVRETEHAREALALIAEHLDPVAALNRRSRTWRELSDAERDVTDADSALKLAAQHPALIKRPLLVGDDRVRQGFDPADWQALSDG